MGNKNLLKLAALLLIPAAVFMLQNSLANYAKSNISAFVNTEPVKEIGSLTANSRESFDILKSGDFNFSTENVMNGVKPSSLSKYFYKSSLSPRMETYGGEASAKTAPPTYYADMIYVGQKDRYASFGGLLLKIGDKTPYGETIRKITNKGILVKGKWGSRWITVKY